MDAWLFHPFDQYRYASETPVHGQGACEGWIREAMRRIDRSDAAVPPDVTDVAHQMSADTTMRRRGLAQAQFGRVTAFQNNASALGLLRYRLRAIVHFNQERARIDNINAMVRSLGSGLHENEMAFVRIVMNARRPNTGEYGHALLVQRNGDGNYSIFDPNNGAFMYESLDDMQMALEGYLESAFHEPALALEAVPHSIQYFSRSPAAVVAELLPPMTPLQAPPVRILPPASTVTRELYDAPADEASELSSDVISVASGVSGRETAPAFAYYALRSVAQGLVPDLAHAIVEIRGRLTNRLRRADLLQEINRLGKENPYGLVADMPNRTRRPGSIELNTAARLLADLREHFGSLRDPENVRLPYRNDFAELRMSLRGVDGNVRGGGGAAPAAGEHVIVVQRRGRADAFEQDAYDLYEPDMGVFRYTNFAELSQALQGVVERGYPESGGIDHVDTIYFGHYDDEPASTHTVPITPTQHESPTSNLLLSGVEPLAGVSGIPSRTAPVANLTPEPDFGYENPVGTVTPSHDELKRSLGYPQDRRPFALYRPSTLTPEELARRGGFEADRTLLRNVSLDMHNFDVASHLHLTDSAGYLATFREQGTASARLPAGATQGFIYFVAPTPNMVDVNGSLGTDTRKPESKEVAAMGRIDYTQIRGWRPVKNGTAGAFVRNPAYRWDVYNQTRTAGAQPLLSRIPLASDAWRKPIYNAFVSKDSKGETKGFNQDLNQFHAYFYDNAWEKVRELQERQAAGKDYRGPLTIEAYGGTDMQLSGTHLYVDAYGAPTVSGRGTASSTSPWSKHTFTFGEDGRLHVADDYKKVLRVGADGYVYVGGIPSHADSTNGVFKYTGSQLIHFEDGKFLTAGTTVYTPFVTREAAGSRSRWSLRSPDRRQPYLPEINEYTFWNLTGGRRRLYLFEADPDALLPKTTTHFVTKVPGDAYQGNFVDYVNLIRPGEIRAVSAWLRDRNAAWLFRDGFYVTVPAPGLLEARTLDGIVRWQARSDPEGMTTIPRNTKLASTYQVKQDTWDRICRREDRRTKLLSRFN
ncbi:enterotoxin A family protein [Paraburkholderia sp. 2C]